MESASDRKDSYRRHLQSFSSQRLAQPHLINAEILDQQEFSTFCFTANLPAKSMVPDYFMK